MTPPPFLSLESMLRCPDRSCGRIALRAALQEGALECEACGSHWWAFRLPAGDVRDRLLADFDGDAETVDGLMTIFGLPESIDRPMYWQILLTGNHWHHYVTDRESNFRARSLVLLRRIFSLHRAAS